MNQTIHAQQADHGEIDIPFTLTDYNNIVVSAVVNGTDTLNLMLHTAATDVTLTEDATRKSKSIKFTGTDKMKSWGGEADSRFSKGNQVQIGDLQRNNINIWEDKNSGKDTDGKFGLDFFQNRIVEIDFDHRRIVLHDNLPRKVEKYERLKIENQNGQLLVQGSCLIEGKTYTNRFLIHSGYSGGILMDDAFAAKAGVDGKIRITNESSLKDSFGHTIRVKKGILPVFVLGSSKISNVPAGFFAGAIGAQKMSIIGSEILKQFNIIFDIANNDLYIAPRHA
ncbi:MAG: aspartyl protease family protein [Blastocatellia bacterium]